MPFQMFSCSFCLFWLIHSFYCDITNTRFTVFSAWVLVTSVNLTSITYGTFSVIISMCLLPFCLLLGTLIRCVLELLALYVIYLNHFYNIFHIFVSPLHCSLDKFFRYMPSSTNCLHLFQSALAYSLKF